MIKPLSTKQMERPDGSVCQTPEENATVIIFARYMKEIRVMTKVFLMSYHSIRCTRDMITCQLMMKLELQPKSSRTKHQVNRVLCQNCGKVFLIVTKHSTCLKSIVLQFWTNEIVPDEWNIGRLFILPKKGDLALPKTYRGLMLLEIAYKIVAIIFHSRLLPIEESLDHETQCGFRPGRGCMDAIFTIKSAVKKRREHGLESWVLFLDLVKAFDRVPIEMLWKILSKFGVPEKLINLLKALHTNFVVTFTVDDVTQIMDS